MPLQLGHGVQGKSAGSDNFPCFGSFTFDVTVRVDFYSGGAMLSRMKLEGDLITFKPYHLKTAFRCNLWNVAMRVKKMHPHALFIYEMDHEGPFFEEDTVIILFSCNNVRNDALDILRRTGALLLDETDNNLFGPRPGTERIDTHNVLGDYMRREASMPDMHVIF